VTHDTGSRREPISVGERPISMHIDVMRRALRLAPLGLAAVLVLGACGSDGDDAAEEPPPTPIETSNTPSTTPTTAPPATVPASTPPSSVPSDQLYEVIGTVIEESGGPRLCYVVLESLPPQCGDGVQLVDWSWDSITVEMNQNEITWVDQIYLTGTYDPEARSFTVVSAGLPTDSDRERLLLARPLPDFSVPCAPPPGGWPARTEEWPGEQIAALEGYAGAWIDEAQHVFTVKFTGDLAAAEAAVRERYDGALCVVSAEHTAEDLSAIQQQLLEMSSVQFLGTAVHVDASGEWVAAETFAPDPAHQAAFDEEFGVGVVRLSSWLQPVPGT
jgi:hypothetical protein